MVGVVIDVVLDVVVGGGVAPTAIALSTTSATARDQSRDILGVQIDNDDDDDDRDGSPA